MADNRTPPRKPDPQEQRTGVAALFDKIKIAILVLIGSLVLSLIIEWLGIAFIWPEQGFRHSQKMLEAEIGWLSTDFKRSVMHSSPVRASEQFIAQSYEFLFVKSGFMAFVEQTRRPSPRTSQWQLDSYALFGWLENYLLATVYVTLTFLVRLIILSLTLPLFALAAITGFVDGLVRRDLRRFGAGRESGFVYHHAKRTIVPLFFSAWVIYLSLPFSLHPNWVLLPCAVLLGLAVSVTAGAFKKYI